MYEFVTFVFVGSIGPAWLHQSKSIIYLVDLFQSYSHFQFWFWSNLTQRGWYFCFIS